MEQVFDADNKVWIDPKEASIAHHSESDMAAVESDTPIGDELSDEVMEHSTNVHPTVEYGGPRIEETEVDYGLAEGPEPTVPPEVAGPQMREPDPFIYEDDDLLPSQMTEGPDHAAVEEPEELVFEFGEFIALNRDEIITEVNDRIKVLEKQKVGKLLRLFELRVLGATDDPEYNTVQAEVVAFGELQVRYVNAYNVYVSE